MEESQFFLAEFGKLEHGTQEMEVIVHVNYVFYSNDNYRESLLLFDGEKCF